VWLGACASADKTVRPDDMSAAAHKEAAAKEHAAADADQRSYNPAATRVGGLGNPPPYEAGAVAYPETVYNPTEGYLRLAEKHRAHARQHEAAARDLERFEEAECRNFPPATRAACPLLSPTVAIEDIPGGVRVKLVPGTRVDAVVAHMRCHYAYARSHGFETSAGCPLYIRGLVIKESDDRQSIELLASGEADEREVRLRSREEAVFVGGEHQ
jgi:hypothetical protein